MRASWTSARLYLSEGCHVVMSAWAIDTLSVSHDTGIARLFRWAHSRAGIELQTLSGELIDTWVLSYGHSPVSWFIPEYWGRDTLWWAHCGAEVLNYGHSWWAHSELSIELWTLSGEAHSELSMNYGHCLVSSLIPEYSRLRTLSGEASLIPEYWAYGHCQWAHSEWSIQLWTLLVRPIWSEYWTTDTLQWAHSEWVFNYGHSWVSLMEWE